MTKPIIKIHNQETGEILEREMNAEEFSQWEADMAAFAAAEAERIAAEQAAEEAKVSARAKLSALGLTAEEIAALSK